jgi:hypothetical protein
MARRLELDAARGLMLVWITFTHLPTALSAYVNQPFGFVSAAEGFIFLSALFTGQIYYRLGVHDGYGVMRGKLWMRTLRLYGYHALLLAFAFLVAVPIAAHGNRPALHNLLDFYFTAGPKHAIIEAALLVYRPPLLDILPMYIIFLVFTPIALSLAPRFGWKPILTGSFTLWLLAQMGLRQTIYEISRFVGVRIPLNEMGSFDLWAWQFWWLIGIWFGVRWAQGNLPVENWARRVLAPSVVIACAFLGLRYAISSGLELRGWEGLFDKWHFGVLRIVNSAAVAAILVHFQSLLKPLVVRPLVLLGQSSLQVFCTHLLFCFAGLTLMGNATMLGGWRQFALLITTLAAMLLTAKVFAKSEAKHEPKSQANQGLDAAPRDGAAPVQTAA